jgi:hypothetical protein
MPFGLSFPGNRIDLTLARGESRSGGAGAHEL